ncbi:MAG: hypothetical protein Q8K82_11390 [Gemmatimonadaceae bacterium]|nr:hypothetical protein [Gemmatimonadaceae bacterium]
MTKIAALPTRVRAAALCICLLGCDSFSADCISIGRFAVAFTLRDAATNAEVTSGAVATLVGGAFADTVTVPPGQARYSIGPERDGSMRLAIRAPGYLRWEHALTIRRSGPCDYLQTTDLGIRLQRSAGS